MLENSIPHSRPYVGSEETEAVARVLARGQLAQGSEVEAFEFELASFLKTPCAVAVCNGTAALHLSLLFQGARPGKNVILPSYCCVSLLNSVAYTGAEARLVDSLPDSPDMDLQAAQALVNPDTVAVVLPHLFGRAVPTNGFSAPSLLLEDATQSLGATDGQHFVGTHGQAGVFSFYATKMICGGEAGALVCRDAQLEASCKDLRDYDGRDDWKMRYNYKMSDLTAALLRVQLRRLPFFLQRREQIASYYRQELSNLGKAQILQPTAGDAHYRFVLQVKGPTQAVVEALQAKGVALRRPVLRPIHHYLKGTSNRDFPHAQRWWERCLSIPIYPALSDAEAEQVVFRLRKELE